MEKTLMTSTSMMREAWAPPCTGPFARMSLHGEGVITVRANTVAAWRALDHFLIKHNYRTRQHDTGAYNCRKITGGSNYSLHAYGIAVDLNWQSNPYGEHLITDMPIAMIEDIEAVRTKSGHRVFRWGGRYSGNKDAMHFELICTPQQLATGIRPYVEQQPKPEPTKKKDRSMEAALELIRSHYRNARGMDYDVRIRDPKGWQHWTERLLDAYDKNHPLKPITDECGGLLYQEMLRR